MSAIQGIYYPEILGLFAQEGPFFGNYAMGWKVAFYKSCYYILCLTVCVRYKVAVALYMDGLPFAEIVKKILAGCPGCVK